MRGKGVLMWPHLRILHLLHYCNSAFYRTYGTYIYYVQYTDLSSFCFTIRLIAKSAVSRECACQHTIQYVSVLQCMTAVYTTVLIQGYAEEARKGATLYVVYMLSIMLLVMRLVRLFFHAVHAVHAVHHAVPPCRGKYPIYAQHRGETLGTRVP